MISKSISHASFDGWFHHFDTVYDIGEATTLPRKLGVFVTFHLCDVMLFGVVVVQFGIDFASTFGPKIYQKSIQK